MQQGQFAIIYNQPHSVVQRRQIDHIFNPRDGLQSREVWEQAFTELTEMYGLPLKAGDIDLLSRIYSGIYPDQASGLQYSIRFRDVPNMPEERQESTAAHSLSLALMIADVYRGLPDTEAYRQRRNESMVLALIHEIDEVFGESKTETSVAVTPGAVLSGVADRSAESIFSEVVGEAKRQGMQERGFTKADYMPEDELYTLWEHSDLKDNPGQQLVDTRRLALEFKVYDKIIGNTVLNSSSISPGDLEQRADTSKKVLRDGTEVNIPYVATGDQTNAGSSKIPYLAMIPYWRLLQQDLDPSSVPILQKLGRRCAADAGIFIHQLPHIVDETAFLRSVREVERFLPPEIRSLLPDIDPLPQVPRQWNIDNEHLQDGQNVASQRRIQHHLLETRSHSADGILLTSAERADRIHKLNDAAQSLLESRGRA